MYGSFSTEQTWYTTGTAQFGQLTVSPYFCRGVEESASVDDVEKAYEKAALRHHPDKVRRINKNTCLSIFLFFSWRSSFIPKQITFINALQNYMHC